MRPSRCGVLVEVDCSARRSGVPPDRVARLGAPCRRLGLDVRGAFTHPGHAYAAVDTVAVAAADERVALAEAGRARSARWRWWWRPG